LKSYLQDEWLDSESTGAAGVGNSERSLYNLTAKGVSRVSLDRDSGWNSGKHFVANRSADSVSRHQVLSIV